MDLWLAVASAAGSVAEEGLQSDLLDLMLRMGATWVLWLLLGLSVLAFAVGFERLWFYLQARQSGAEQRAAKAFGAGDFEAAKAALDGLHSASAAVIRTALEHAAAGADSVDEHMQATIERERGRLERGLAYLGTLGNNAPFIGLFGTVLGIIRAFNDLAADTSAGGQAVMSGIAESLVTTCIGLAVALPAVAIYNACARHVERTTSDAEAMSHTLLGHLKAKR